jgi:uncharacterized membrane protein HdeD (DUF308 family)
MDTVFARNVLALNWWALLIRGFLALAFGLITWMWPGLTVLVLVLLFGVYAFTDGIFAIVAAVRAARRHEERWWAVAIEGVLGILVGIIAVLRPGAAALGLLFVIAAWALVTGVLEIVAAVRLRKQIRGEWLLALSGVLSLVFGVLLLWRPGPGMVAVAWIIGAYAIAFGAVMLALAIRLKRTRRVEAAPPIGAAPQPA